MQEFILKSTPNSRVVSVHEVEGVYFGQDTAYPDLPRMYRVGVETKDGNGSYIRHQVWLPEAWNGIFVGIGGGGIAGKLGDSICEYAKEGYAVAQTDLGTAYVRYGLKDTPTKALFRDYGWNSTHVMTRAAKELIEGYYGKAPEYSYFLGGSAGGKQALSEVQRFPEDYDGVLARVPSNNSVFLVLHFLWFHIHSKGEFGGSVLNDEEAKIVSDLAVEFFKDRGGVLDGDDFVSLPYAGKDTISDFISYISEKHPSFTRYQLEHLQKIYEGPKNPRTGEQIYCGIPIGTEDRISCFGSKRDDDFGLPWFRLFFGQGFKDEEMDFDKDVEALAEGLAPDFCSNSADLNEFCERGGKLIVYSGSADHLGPWADALNYYRRVCEKTGGYDKVKEFFKYFIIPGMGHGEGARGADLVKGSDGESEVLSDLRAWREHGVPPHHLTAVHKMPNGIDTDVKFKRDVLPITPESPVWDDYPECCSARLLGLSTKK